MITFWNSKTVYIGTDLQKACAVRDQLDAMGIKYRYKVRSRAGERHNFQTKQVIQANGLYF